MSFLKSMRNEEQKGAGVLDTLRKKAGLLMTRENSDEDQDSVFDMVEDAMGDTYKFVRRAISQAAQSVSEIGSSDHRMSSSYNDRVAKSAHPSAERLNSEVRLASNGANARQSPGVAGRLSSVSVGASPTYGEETAFSTIKHTASSALSTGASPADAEETAFGTIRRTASSAFSSMKSLLSGPQVNASSNNDEELAEIVRQYTDGQTNGNSDWTIRLVENQKKFRDQNMYRTQAVASPTTFVIKYDGNGGTLEVGFNGKADFP